MATLDPDRPAPWEPAAGALDRSIWEDPADARPTTILLQHPSVPFEREVPFDNEVEVRRAAGDYVGEAVRRAALDVPPWWLAALRPGAAHPEFGWLDTVPAPAAGCPRPIGSVRLADSVAGRPPSGRALVLLAGERSGGLALGSEFGIRVVVLPLLRGGADAGIRILGLSASLPFGDYASDGARGLRLDDGGRLGILEETLAEFRRGVAAALALREGSVFFRGIRASPPDAGGGRRLELRGRGLRGGAGREDPYEFLAQARTTDDLRGAVLLGASEALMSACMGGGGQAMVFRCDPASEGGPGLWRRRRPTRGEAELDAARQPEPRANPLREAGEFDVVQTWFVLGDNPGPNADAPRAVPRPGAPPPAGPVLDLPIRSNDFSAVSAFAHMSELFDRLRTHGLPAAAYFRHAALPLRAHYRSGIRPGPGKDGQAVNGRVLPKGWGVNAVVGPAASPPPVLDVHLALGDLSTRARAPWDGANRSPAEPLGFAADPRWAWHEAAHVLLMAALGELELRFAHSMGDGLAAIAGDPCSRFPDGTRWRGMTFPWIFSPRRHDRCVLHGWGWSGSLHRALLEVPEERRISRKGYRGEQILSSSLFRMYRCLGGDTLLGARDGAATRAARGRASDYAIYLVMKALQLLGDPGVVPAARAEQFADALILADAAADAVPLTAGAPWVGGLAGKAVDWAFRAQGAGRAAPAAAVDAPGPPPRVDVYIRDGRGTSEAFPGAAVEHGAGSYVPVSLDWGGLAGGAAGAPPAWFVHDAALRRDGDALRVAVGNRGGEPALGVRVRLWALPWAGGDPPPWTPGAWAEVAAAGPLDIGPGETEEFELPGVPAGANRHLLLAEATCADDRSNIDPLAGRAPSRAEAPLPELVALDNNLGLAVSGLA